MVRTPLPSAAARFTWVVNPDYHKSNGVSALKARNALHDNFLLLMADHIFEPETARAMVRQHLGPGEVILGVDPKSTGSSISTMPRRSAALGTGS